MNAFVKIEQGEAHLVIRVPLHVTKTVRFPIKGVQLDLANSGPAIQSALASLGRDISIWEDGRLLTAKSASGRLTLPSDRSFERYEDAVALVARQMDPETGIYIDQGYLDAHLTYPISSPAARFAIRTRVALELKAVDADATVVVTAPAGATASSAAPAARPATARRNIARHRATPDAR